MQFLLLAALAATAGAQANSMNKIVGMLQDMRKTVQAEGEREAADFDKHSEWYRTTEQETGYAVADATDALEGANACAAESAAKAEEEQSNIVTVGGKIAQNEKDLEEATAVRKQENGDFVKSQAELSDTIDTLVRAASIIRRATGGSGSAGAGAKLKAAFVQVAKSLDAILDAAFVSTADRKKLSAFLQAGQQSEDGDFVEPTAAAYAEHSSGIVDLLADLKQKAEGELSDLRKEEANKQHAFDMLSQSLRDSTSTLNGNLGDAKTNLAVQQEENAKCTGTSTEQAKIEKESEGYHATLIADYETATAEFNDRKEDRVGELAALDKAIEILSAGGVKDAADRRGTFLQTKLDPDTRQQVAELLQSASTKLGSIELAQLAVHARDDAFGKVKGLISDMIAKLQKQAAEEADHKAYCDSEKKKNEAKRDDRAGKLDTYSTRLEKAKANSAQLKQDVAKLSKQISEMDAAFQAATQNRQEENAAYNSLMEDCRVQLEAVSKAIGVLKDFYGSAKSHEEKSDSANNVVAFLETVESDLIKSKNDAEGSEKDSAAAYEKMQNEYEQLRASRESSSKGKESENTRLGGMISDLQSDVEGTSAELDATLAYLTKLKGSCVHKVMSFEERAAKAQQEIASLQQALEILESETAESFLQRRK